MASMCHLKCVALWTLKDECGVTMTVDDASIMVAHSSRIDAEILNNVSQKYEKLGLGMAGGLLGSPWGPSGSQGAKKS